MLYDVFKQWVEKVAISNGHNQDIIEILDSLHEIINQSFSNENTIAQIKNHLQLLIHLDYVNPKQPINYPSVQSAGIIYERFNKPHNVEAFKTTFLEAFKVKKAPITLPVDIPAIPTPSEANKIYSYEDAPGYKDIYIKIEEIFKKFREEVSKTISYQQWHKLFIENEIASLKKVPTIDLVADLKTYEGRVWAQSFIYRNSAYHKVSTIVPQNVSALEPKNTAEATAKEIIDYSIALEGQNPSYSHKVDCFKKTYPIHIVTHEAALKALAEIKTLIEKQEWILGKWGSRSTIIVEGKAIQVPNHIFTIYLTIEKGITSGAPFKALSEINSIATKAKTHKPFFFASYRERNISTQLAYEEIEHQTNSIEGSSLLIKEFNVK